MFLATKAEGTRVRRGGARHGPPRDDAEDQGADLVIAGTQDAGTTVEMGE